MTINSDGCASYYPWHVPRPHGGQRKTGAITRSYLTLWKLPRILVPQCLLIEGGVVPCEFIDIFLDNSQEECGCWNSLWSIECLCSFSVVALVSVLLLISRRMFRTRCSRRSRRGSEGFYMQTLNEGIGGDGITFLSGTHLRLLALRTHVAYSGPLFKLWLLCSAVL